MFVREFGWGRLVLGLMVGLLIFGASAVAQDYMGYKRCGVACHKDIYDTYSQHGHPWIEVATERQQPGADLFGFAAFGLPIPDPTNTPALAGVGAEKWADVAAILGNFHAGAGSFVRASDGKRVSVGGTTGSTYTPRCFRCHNPTGYVADTSLKMYGIAAWAGGAPATDYGGKRLNGVQCEHCHGPEMTMLKPDGLVCRDCHSRTDPDPFNPTAPWDYNRRIAFAPTADGKTGVFTNHRPQGDEFRRSPHKAVTDSEGRQLGCILCHDPHKSVWKDQGGVKFASSHGVGDMCLECHKTKRVRGAMGELGLECVDCHMPEKSRGTATKQPDGTYRANEPRGYEPSHLFRINPTALKAADNFTAETVMSGTPPAPTTTYYWKSPGPDPNDPNTTIPWARDGDSFLTLDMVCADCHANMTIAQMASYAKAIHRQPGLVDLTVNNSDALQVVKKADQVSVDFSIEAGDKNGMKAEWWVVCQGPKGWSSWNGKKWVPGFKAWRKGVALADVPQQNVLKSKLPPGHYTYWISIDPTDGSENFDSVPLYVKKR